MSGEFLKIRLLEIYRYRSGIVRRELSGICALERRIELTVAKRTAWSKVMIDNGWLYIRFELNLSLFIFRSQFKFVAGT